MNQETLKKKISEQSLEPLEKKIMDKANFDYICKYNGKVPLKDCIKNAVSKITYLNDVQFCSIFSIFNNDMELYIEKIYRKMQEMGAE